MSNCNCQNNVQLNNYPNNAQINNCNCQNNSQTNYNFQNCGQKELLKQIECCAFAIQELTLYLDTHPTDARALCLHNKYCKDYKILTDKYQKVYGPLTQNYPCNKWRWIEEPWPWEGGND